MKLEENHPQNRRLARDLLLLDGVLFVVTALLLIINYCNVSTIF